MAPTIMENPMNTIKWKSNWNLGSYRDHIGIYGGMEKNRET